MNDSFTYGAFEKGELVGIITLYEEKLYKLRHRVHIGAMYVSDSIRGLGIGKALMGEAIEKAKNYRRVGTGIFSGCFNK